VGVVHTRETVLAAFELREAGLSERQICRELNLGKGTIQRWFTEPRMDPYLDEIAIERAVKGDILVYDALTYFEMDEALRYLADRKHLIDIAERFGKDAERVLHAVEKVQERDEVRRRRAAQLARPRPKGVTRKKRSPEFDDRALSLRAQGLTVEAIAAELDTSRSTVSRILADAA
jgi:DNA invertase Pin-like site-specific DNA recombinase